MTRYKILRATPTFIETRTGLPKPGKSLTVLLVDFDEEHTIDVESLDPLVVEPAIEALIEQRERLDQLGE